MKLLECYIENFGMLHEYSYKFDDGLNCICAENGTGKTTLSVFIKAMLYGLDDGRKRELDENDRKKYAPWQGGRYGGSLTFSHVDKIYRIERTFGSRPSDDEFVLIDANSGAKSADFSENVGECILGIDREGFEHTVFLSEKNLSGKIENASVAAKLSEIVGSDGDIGGYNEARARLEDRRRFYQKRGNSGEISVIKSKISDCDDALARLERVRASSKEYEAELSRIESEITNLEDERVRLEGELESARSGMARNSQRVQYSVMLTNLKAEREKLHELEEYFKNGVPSSYEIDEVRDAWREATRLKETRRESEPEELTELREFFSHNTDFREIDEMRRRDERLTELRAEYSMLEAKINHGEDTLKEEFGGPPPTKEQLIAYRDIIDDVNKSKISHSIVLPIAGAAVLCIALLLGIMVNPLLFLLSILGVALIVAGLVLRKRKNKDPACPIAAIGKSGDIRGELTRLIERIEAHEISLATDGAELERLEREISECDGVITEYLSHFAHGMSTYSEALVQIGEKYNRFYALSVSERESRAAMAEADVRITYLEEKASEFLSKYKTTGLDPFEEIRVKANSYNYGSMAVKRLEAECESYAKMHGITEYEEAPTEGEEALPKIERLLKENREKLTDARRRQVYAESAYNDALSECEEIDEVTAAREEYSEILGKYTENLEVIKSTLLLLEEASNNMTARYIGGTKERFLHYEKMIGGCGGEYTLDTHFVVRKNDRGATRSVDSYSRGTKDLCALALRLALVDSLYGGECPLIILDDPLTALDDKRVQGARELIRELAKEKQVLYFTCSEARIV